MNWLQTFLLVASLSISQTCFSQSILIDDASDFKLLKSGVQKVRVFKNSALTEVWVIDSGNYSITKFIDASFAANHLPSSFEDLAVSSIVRSKFHPFGGVDSIITIECNNIQNLDDANPQPKRCDTTIFHYTYALNKLAVNRKKFKIDRGRLQFFRTDYFGYNDGEKLILLLQSDGNTQFFYEYGENGKIARTTINCEVEVLYSYNSYGHLINRSSESQNITYEYNEDGFLSKKTIEGKDSATWTYEYEF